MGAGALPFPLPGLTDQERRSAGLELAARVRRRINIAHTVAGFVGAVDVFVLLWWVLPAPAGIEGNDELLLRNVVTFAVFLPLASIAGIHLGRKVAASSERWLAEGRAPTSEEQAETLREPLACAWIDAALWFAGAVVFAAVNASTGWEMAAHVFVTALMGGATMVAIVYLLTERLLRPVTAAALASGPAPRPVGPGITCRLLLAWLFATGVPLAGLAWLGVEAIVKDRPPDEVARSVVVLSLVAIIVGLVATFLVARSVSDPLDAVRRALRRVESGDLDAEVRVEDGSEVGLLQAGFNRMAAGLRERERIRDLFGRHVGEDVARAALERGGALGGEVRDVAVLFVDVAGSTKLAAERPPEEVVELLNRFFSVVVEVTGRHGGWVNKFEGDAALVVFGCPDEHDDCAGAALAAARELRDRLPLAVPALRAGIGVSAGPCVAGNVGAERRFEYTVIGDPVNEASRLCELAKQRPERLVASEAVLRRTKERHGYRLAERVQLRGRATETRLAVPA